MEKRFILRILPSPILYELSIIIHESWLPGVAYLFICPSLLRGRKVNELYSYIKNKEILFTVIWKYTNYNLEPLNNSLILINLQTWL